MRGEALHACGRFSGENPAKAQAGYWSCRSCGNL